MKKILSLVLILMLTFPMLALAEIDLSSYSNDELIALQTPIKGELMNRGAIKSAKIPTGNYTVGEDFPAGVYTMTTDEYMVAVTINEYEDLYTLTPDSPVGKITLKDGQTFSCTGPVTLTTYTGITFN